MNRWRAGWAGIALLAVCLVSAPLGARAGGGDWNRADDPLLEAVGLHAGKIGGTGLAFKFPLQWWLYGQVAGGIWHTSDNQRHNLGLSVQYVLRQERSLRVYLGAGMGYYYHKERREYADAPDSWTTHDSWNSGFGVGIETLRRDRFSFQVEGDFTHESDDDSFVFFPQIGAFYYF